MSKLYFKAVRTLPLKFVDDATVVSEVLRGAVVAMNPKFAPVMYTKGKWRRLQLASTPRPERA